jgi:putative N6-adenine-specific DNA methylase
MKIVAKTLYGLENVLADELKSLGAGNIEIANRAVIFNGNRKLLYRVNYCAATALSFLVNIADFHIRSKEDLFREGIRIPWEKIMGPDDTFAIVPVVNSNLFNHSGYAGLILKDCIADHFRNLTGRRPSVRTTDPDILINLHISGQKVDVSVDSSGIPLYKRGYRKEQSAAPLNEVLAAGILRIAGWDGSMPLIDPMCGSGTIPVEAGLLACKIPPGSFRKLFAFQRWKDYDQKLFEDVKEEADSRITDADVKIFASDISTLVLEHAATNIRSAGLEKYINLEEADFSTLQKKNDTGVIIMNPPYGE